jgi:hypothetical protein
MFDAPHQGGGLLHTPGQANSRNLGNIQKIRGDITICTICQPAIDLARRCVGFSEGRSLDYKLYGIIYGIVWYHIYYRTDSTGSRI